MADHAEPSILERIIADARVDVAERKRRIPLAELRTRVADAAPTRGFADALQALGVSLIAEFKRTSPSKGDIFPDAVPADVASGYAQGGARAVSVLTNTRYFRGSDDDLRDVRAAIDLPILRKDFTVDAYQIYEARAMGADAILLIVAALDDTELIDMLGVAREIGIDALVETHDEVEIERALSAGATIIGINNRNLHTFETTLETTLRLRNRIPADRIVVSESGIHSRDDVRRLEAVGVDAILVGESVMRSAASIPKTDAQGYRAAIAQAVKTLLGSDVS